MVKINWSLFQIDNFILADILNTTRRTKLEESHDFFFFNIKSLTNKFG
jgi:magnesium transporter